VGATFDAVIFDCDGVLVDSEAVGLDASADYLQGHGLPYRPADLVRNFTGLRDDVFEAELASAYRSANGAPPPDDFFDGLVAARRSRGGELRAIEGASAALRSVRLLKAVASSSRETYLLSKLRRTGLHDLVAPHIYSAERVARGKPAPDIFLYAAEKLGVAPGRTLVVEDSAHGVAAGVAAGMTVWGFVGGGHCFDGHAETLTRAGAARVISDFEAFRAAVSEVHP
jgi:beta-phosphoglucomutase-like phosphatase (HAD superfamily)